GSIGSGIALYHRSHDLRGVQQRLGGKVRITLRGPRLGMSEELLHHEQRDALIDEKAGVAVSQVVQANTRQARTATNAPPLREQRHVGLSGDRRGEYPRIAGYTLNYAQQVHRCSVKRNSSWPS